MPTYSAKEPVMVKPSEETPRHSLYLSNLDDHMSLRFPIRYMYLFERRVEVEALKESLSRVLVEYYPLAGRLRACGDGEKKLEVECNGEGALFVEGFLDLSAGEVLEGCERPSSSWREVFHRVEGERSWDVPPLVIQVIHLNCGGMVLHSAISHCVCDGIGTAQFLRAWAQLTAHPNSDPCVVPFHTRDMLKPREPPRINFSHPEYKILRRNDPFFERTRFLDPLPLAPISVTFTSSEILRLKQFHDSSPKCTSFEALASHVWRAWVKSKDMPPDNRVKLLFTVDARRKLSPNLPSGFYGNGFVTACAETSAGQLVMSDVHHGVQLIRQAKEGICDGYVRSAIDMLESKRAAPDCSSGFVISQWSKLGLEDLDFGEGRPVYMGPPFPTSYVYCLFLPVIGDLHAVRVWMSVHQSTADKFERSLKVFPALPLNHVHWLLKLESICEQRCLPFYY